MNQMANNQMMQNFSMFPSFLGDQQKPIQVGQNGTQTGTMDDMMFPSESNFLMNM
jgi:hypothetical protein